MDAVGDLTQLSDPTTAAKWGPSIGLFQVRALRDPTKWGTRDRVREASKLRDPAFNARAAHVISVGGTNWTPWTVYRTGAYEQYRGRDFDLRTGHALAHRWDA